VNEIEEINEDDAMSIDLADLFELDEEEFDGVDQEAYDSVIIDRLRVYNPKVPIDPVLQARRRWFDALLIFLVGNLKPKLTKQTSSSLSESISASTLCLFRT
jgi:hypothetical protein